jgi:signal transduction histidine kinase
VHTLLRNAIDRMPTGGMLTVTLELDAGGVLVSVRDNGPTIDTLAAQNAFSPFADARRDGTGLALPICRRIIEAHGGALWLETEGGGGATFRFRLPASGAAVQSPTAAFGPGCV